jgi:hypothetical protein
MVTPMVTLLPPKSILLPRIKFGGKKQTFKVFLLGISGYFTFG